MTDVGMSLNHGLVGVPSEPQERSWASKDALLYAVGVEAGLGDPLQELEFTTENCADIEQKVLPTYAVLVAQARTGRKLCDSDPARFRSMSGRFSRPVLPGEALTVSIWRPIDGADGGGTSLFQTTRPDGTVVIDRGRLQVRDA
jgi:hypothetical protein